MPDEPKKLETSHEKLKALRKGTKHFVAFEFPGMPEISMAVRVCSQGEITDSLSKGRKKADAEMYNPTASDYLEYQEREILYNSIMTEDGEEKFFPSSDSVGDETVDTRIILIEKYNEVQEEFSPVKDIKTEEDFLNTLSEVKKNSQIGLSLSSYTLRKLLSFLIAHPNALLKGNGSISTLLSPNEETSKKNPIVKQESESSENPKEKGSQKVETQLS